MDLSTTYLGLELDHPVVASSSPLTRDLDGLRRLEDAGAAAAVMPSVYEEEIEAEDQAMIDFYERGSLAQPEAAGYFSEAAVGVGGLETRLETLRRAADACSIPIIASINGSTPTGWVEFAHELEQAGASAIELNLYSVPTDPQAGAGAVEDRWLETVRTVADAISAPLAVKIGPWLTSPAHFVGQLEKAGASGVVLFNRFYEPDIDLDSLMPVPDLELSHSNEIRQALMWIALLHGRTDLNLAATGGVTDHREVVKFLLTGADIVMSASALLRHGPDHIGTLRDGLSDWMEVRGFEAIGDLRGQVAADHLADPENYVRSQYMKILTGYGHQ